MPARRPLRSPAVVLILVAILAACGTGGQGGGGGGGGGSPAAGASAAADVAREVPPGATLSLVTGAGQAMVRGSSLAPFVVRVADAQGAPLEGVDVAWTVTEGNGTIRPPVSRTRPDGTAWALATTGLASARNRYAVAVAGLEAPPLAVEATGTVGPPARILEVGGANQTAVVGTALPVPLVVRVLDANGVPVPSVQVAWAVTTGGGAVVSQRASTDAEGLASALVRLGKGAGTNTFTAAGLGFSAGVVSFVETGVAGEPARLARLSPAGGTFPAGSTQGLAVRLTDRYGNPVQGATVRWARTAGSGAADQGSSQSGAGGVASGTVTLGAEPGPNGFSAALPHVRRAVVTFSLSGT